MHPSLSRRDVREAEMSDSLLGQLSAHLDRMLEGAYDAPTASRAKRHKAEDVDEQPTPPVTAAGQDLSLDTTDVDERYPYLCGGLVFPMYAHSDVEDVKLDTDTGMAVWINFDEQDVNSDGAVVYTFATPDAPVRDGVISCHVMSCHVMSYDVHVMCM